jgi:hypothetical protein
MKTKITALLFFNMIAISSYAQYDWTQGQLILKNSDTLVGEIRLPMISKNLVAINGEEKVTFRKDRKSEKTKYSESQVDKVIFRNSDSGIIRQLLQMNFIFCVKMNQRQAQWLQLESPVHSSKELSNILATALV